MVLLLLWSNVESELLVSKMLPLLFLPMFVSLMVVSLMVVTGFVVVLGRNLLVLVVLLITWTASVE